VEGGRKGRKWLNRYLEHKRATWPQALSGSPLWYSGPFEEYGVRYLPLHLLIGRDGRILEINPRGEELDRAIERALGAEAEADSG